MNALRWASIVLTVCTSSASAAAVMLAYPPQPIRSVYSPNPSRSAAIEAQIADAIADNIRQLGLGATAQPKNPSALLLPLGPDAPAAASERHVIANFFDHNPAFPNFVRDYNCGTRSFDRVDGYNQTATDFMHWPFPWQGMAQNSMRVHAAASGVIVARVEGNPDRSCGVDGQVLPNLMAIRHFDGSVSRYLNLRSALLTDKQVGKVVAAGELLGVVGASGASAAPHLSFEMRDAQDQPIDPYAGACNASPGRWAEQPAYRDSRLLMVAPHHAPPTPSPGCGEVERPNYRWRFAPGDEIFLAAYLRDLHRGDPLAVEVLRPDGSRFAQADLDTGAMDSEYYDAAHWYASTRLPQDAAQGVWRVRYRYQERDVEARFAVGGNALRGSGAWYDPAQSGQGLMVEVVEGEADQARVALSYFTYVDGEPVWMNGTALLQGERASVPLQIGSGANFPPAFRTRDLVLAPWGQMEIEFTGVDTLTATWTTTQPRFGNGSLSLQRLTQLADANEDGFDSGMRACVSGSWYNPAESGYGLQIQAIDTAQGRVAALIWYAFHNGQPYWMDGVAPIPSDGKLVVPMGDGSGGQFPPNFDPDQVERQAWGDVEFELVDSNTAVMSWRTDRAGFPASGRIPLVRLTQTLEANCR